MKTVDSIEQSKSNNLCTHMSTFYMIQTAVHTDENGCEISFQNNPKDLDPSYKMDLDLWDCLGRIKLVL